MKTKPIELYDFSKKIISNVPVYYKTLPLAPCIHIQVCFDVGSYNDPENIVGVSHFLEHMIFDGSPKLPTKKEIREWSKIHALNSWNAWTSTTQTTYHLRCLPEKFDAVLVGMKDMIFNPLLRKEDVEHERSVIAQEAWGRFKNEKFLAYARESLKNIFQGTVGTYGSYPIGWPETISKITQEDLAKWHKENYGRGNFIIMVAGAVNKDHLKKLQDFLKGLPIAEPKKVKFGNIRKPLKTNLIKKSDEIGDPREQAEISIGRVALNKDIPNEGLYVVMNSMLYDLLFERLRTELALCYSVAAKSYVSKHAKGWFMELKVKEENLEVVKKEFWKALDDIISGKEKKRFETIKKVKADQIRSREMLTEDIIDDVLSFINRFNKITTRQEMLNQVEKVTYSDVVKNIKDGFRKNLIVTEVILPSKK